ncbi:MAG: methylmalonyl Co-A mutase-associated GTPase MeaB [Flavobacteriaceae bacterium]|nr:MAG: methylmalonyl Co-A mutase-associated GTPase MeaB [Flavobacteriaceae bacterium]
MNKNRPSSLYEKDEVSKSKTTRIEAVKNVKLNRGKLPGIDDFVNRILNGDITFLSRAITLVESTNTKHQEKANRILEGCLPHAHHAVRIGITGVPGVGKSTFIESFGKYLTGIGKKVAVLAVDPSSSISKGSILGDKTRMETLVIDKNAFIRPSPSGISLGGVAQKTKESIILCEAAGFDIIIVETVGVGQSETTVHAMVDFFLLLKLYGAGDELQGIKRGIIEMADAIVINKADGDAIKQAKIAQTEFSRALHLYPPKESGWQPKVMMASALENKGIEPVYHLIKTYIQSTKESGFFTKKRNDQNIHWLLATIDQQLKDIFYQDKKNTAFLEREIEKLKNGTSTPFLSAKKLMALQ